MRPLLLALLLAGPAFAQAPATVEFTFDNPALQPAHYTLLVHEDGTGHFHSEPGAAPVPGALQPEPLDRDVIVNGPLRTQLFTVARKNKLFATQCDSGHKNLAFTGNKTLRYTGPEGQGSCTFNYAKNQQISEIADSLIAVATTLEEGRKLQLLLAHDKLGLNAEMDILTEQQAGGRALEIGNIAPVLQAVAADPEVLNHTRSSARALLAH